MQKFKMISPDYKEDMFRDMFREFILCSDDVINLKYHVILKIHHVSKKIKIPERRAVSFALLERPTLGTL